MLYLDSSALAKRYFQERGSHSVSARFVGGEAIYTSVLSYGEVHAAMGRKFRLNETDAEELERSRDAFTEDWLFGLSQVELSVQTMSALPKLVEVYDLKAGDAIHLSAALWLRDTIYLRTKSNHAREAMEFGVADRRLGWVATQCGLQVFDPESEP